MTCHYEGSVSEKLETERCFVSWTSGNDIGTKHGTVWELTGMTSQGLLWRVIYGSFRIVSEIDVKGAGQFSTKEQGYTVSDCAEAMKAIIMVRNHASLLTSGTNKR